MLLINRLISSFILIFIFFNLKAQQIEFTEEYSPQINQNSLFKLNMYDSGAKNLWKNLFIDKNFDQISLFIDSLPVNSKERVIQEIIFQILTSNKIFQKNKVSEQQFPLIYNNIIDKLFITGRFNEIEFLYSQYPKLSKTSFVLQKMIEGKFIEK